MRKLGTPKTYEIQRDVKGTAKTKKPVLDINYKTEVPVKYHEVVVKHFSGDRCGLVDKIEFYRDWGGPNEQVVLREVHTYTIDDSDPTLPFSARTALNQTKTIEHVLQADGTFDTFNTKTLFKLYDTREKRHVEGIKRRKNIEEQLIDHVGLAGVLSGAFADENDAFNKLTQLRVDHSAAFGAWLDSGREPLYTDVTNDTTTSWLDTEIPDTPQTQAMCDWMIGLDFREYIVDKLKGNIK